MDQRLAENPDCSALLYYDFYFTMIGDGNCDQLLNNPVSYDEVEPRALQSAAISMHIIPVTLNSQ